MDISIPYRAGLLLGRAVDMRRLNMGFLMTGSDLTPNSPEVNLTTLQYSIVKTLKDVCDLLGVPPEYALKVKALQVDDEVTKACLQGLGNKHTHTVIFTCKFLHKKEYLPYNTVPLKAMANEEENTAGKSDQAEEQGSTDALLDEAIGSLDCGNAGGAGGEPAVDKVKEESSFHKDTHWVKAQEIGNEMFVILRIASADDENLSSIRAKIDSHLGSYRGDITTDKLASLKKLAEKIEKKLSKKSYANVKMDIEYCVYQDLKEYPASMTGMVGVLETFADHCIGWTDSCKHGQSYKVDSCSMTWHVGNVVEKKISIKERLENAYYSAFPPDVGTVSSEVVHFSSDVDDDSFVKLELFADRRFYTIRVTLQSFEGDGSEAADLSPSLTSLAMSQYPETTYSLYDQLLTHLDTSMKAQLRLEAFLSSKQFFVVSNIAEGQKMLKSLNAMVFKACNAVRQLDMVTVPETKALEDILSEQPLRMVKDFIENVTSKLPPGADLDLLILGKTGHGKSETGNSILGKNNYFPSSSSTESATSVSKFGWAVVDGRTIKVVDTPGVCDTNLDSDQANRDLAFRSISEAITFCQGQFDALLIVMSFPIRMTGEEKAAIELLKRVLGKDVMKTHGICVITFGDVFETKKETGTFEEWCKAQKGFMKDLFEECNYRCVLFNNMASDPLVRKRQLMRLVAHADSIQSRGTPYTSELFQYAQSEVKRIQSEMGTPEVNEDMMKDMEQVLEYLNIMMHNTDHSDKHQKELNYLKEKVDALKSRVSSIEEGQMSHLVETVFSLAETIHLKMEEIADRPQPDSPDARALGEGDSAACLGNDKPLDQTSQGAEENVDETGPKSLNDRLQDQRDQLEHCLKEDVAPKVEEAKQKASIPVEEKIRKKHECFPGCSQIWLADGQKIAMKNLEVGHEVLVRDSRGVLRFDTVYTFGHRDREASSEYIVLQTEGENVRVSRKHLVFCLRNGREVCLPAQAIEVGDELLALTSNSQKLEPRPVVGKKVDILKGLYAPFTLEGTIIVDDSLMSCYIDCGLSQSTAHTCLWPVRQMFKVSPHASAWINGLGGNEVKGSPPWWSTASMKVLEMAGVLNQN